jgi:23S rRNA (pseudouridine1915-N3)-methyltransferase
MKIQLLLSGKTRIPYIREGIEEYRRRLVHYADFQIRELPELKKSGTWPEKKVKEEEAKTILKSIDTRDFVVLLDERGQQLDSLAFAGLLEKQQYGSFPAMLFVIGGPYGFAQEVYSRANIELSLSKMTFSHQLVRLIFMEQLYRAYTIMRGESYHHD